MENFNIPGLIHREQIERLISQERVRELEASINLAWEFESREICKEDDCRRYS